MDNIISCTFPALSKEFTDIFNDSEQKLIIVGVIGKSNLPNCNKMTCFDFFACHSVFLDEDDEKERVENRIKFYHEKGSRILFVHFETSFDTCIARDIIEGSLASADEFLPLHSEMRVRFARMLLFATQVCHVVIMVEPSGEFDASYLSIFKALKILREKYVLKFLPKLLRNSSTWSVIAKEFRLCSPRFLFFFECLSRPVADVRAYEIEKEDELYQMLRANFIITNNANLSLFSIPKNKKFLFVNERAASDPVIDSLELLMHYMRSGGEKSLKNDRELYPMQPYRGYAVNYYEDAGTGEYEERARTFLRLLEEHVEEALSNGFDDSIAKYKSKNHFVRPALKPWFEIFKFMHCIFVKNPADPTFEAKDPDYRAYLENFVKIVDIDQQLFSDSCTHGYDLALLNYSELLPHHFSRSFHESKLTAAVEIFRKYARGPDRDHFEEKLRVTCEEIWTNGRQQCEAMSLRGNGCIMPLRHAANDTATHSSGVVYVSCCNCGKTQGHREDPYTLRKANFEFYQALAASCLVCEKSSAIGFPTFVPSSSEFRAAEISSRSLIDDILDDFEEKREENDEQEHHLSASQKTQRSESDLSLSSPSDGDDNRKERRDTSKTSNGDEDDDEDDEDVNEIVVKIGEIDVREEQAAVSTTEYLPGMILTSSPPGLLPQFPSWSLLCIGSSSLYGHNTGLTEGQQSGFLSGTNYLLAWDVKVRLEHAQSWAENYEKTRSRKKLKQLTTQSSNGTFFTLKIFVGMEYECGRGHRFFMDSNHSILRGSKACGSKIVFADMPLYFPCPVCRQSSIAQLMRVHVVTPKAPVHITLDPKVKIRRDTEMIFVSGWNEPAKLTQSSYWILRLPYVYQGESEPISVPTDVPASIEALRYGFLMEGMFSIREDESGIVF